VLAALPAVAQTREAKLTQSLQAFQHELEANPKSVAANQGAGATLDLLGRHEEARRYLAQAVKLAPTEVAKAQAKRMLSVSYGFTSDCRAAEKVDRSAYDFYRLAGDFYNAGEVADEIGRLCLESGDFDTAYDWYRRGHDSGLEEENLPDAHKDLWNFRWVHARARVAVRRGKVEEARKYVAAAKTIVDKGTNPAQLEYFPYLAGYVEFYAGDYEAALKALQSASTDDPFIQCLIAQCYEKLGRPADALEWYRKAAASTAHSVPAAFAIPMAEKKLK
jgi:tetratricopeptide (TPR) repeat protein